jgi:transposase-like protein
MDFMPSEAKCANIVRKLRWLNGIECFYCHSSHIVKFGSQREHINRYLCRKCHRLFNDLTGTIFENSKLQLREWFYMARELQRNTSMNQISKDLNRKYDNVMNACHKIMNSTFMNKFVGVLEGETETDEMYIPVGEKGTKQTKRPPRKRGLKLRGRGTYAKDKPPIVGTFQRGGKAIFHVVHNMYERAVVQIGWFTNGIKYTDDFKSYNVWGNTHEHQTVNHSKKQYAISYIHTNGIEGIFQGLRHWLNTFKGVCKKNLYLFISMFEFNFNHRDLNPMDKFLVLISNMISTI